MSPCAYCGLVVGDTKEHIIPKSVIRKLGIRGPECNVVYVCRWCNWSKGNTVVLPTLENIHGLYRNVDISVICDIADWIRYHRTLFNNIIYRNKPCKYIIHNTPSGARISTMQSMFNVEDYEKYVALYDIGYFDYMRDLYSTRQLSVKETL